MNDIELVCFVLKAAPACGSKIFDDVTTSQFNDAITHVLEPLSAIPTNHVSSEKIQISKNDVSVTIDQSALNDATTQPKKHRAKEQHSVAKTLVNNNNNNQDKDQTGEETCNASDNERVDESTRSMSVTGGKTSTSSTGIKLPQL